MSEFPFKISTVYRELLKGPVDIITRPEIEMLYIISEGKFDDYSKYNGKPSQFVKDRLRCKFIKQYNYVHDYFGNINRLMDSIDFYHRTKKDEITIWNILDANYNERLLWH